LSRLRAQIRSETMKMMSRAVFVAVFALTCAGFTGVALAQTPAPSPAAIALAKQILTEKKASLIYKNAAVNVIMNMKNVLLQQNLNYSKDLNEVADKLAAEMKDRDGEIADAMAKIYASNFTEAELKDLLAFYSSPVGKKSLEVDPRVVNDSMSYIDGWAQKFSEEVNGKIRAEMRKRGKEI
jgi:hypothetical protein